MTTRAFIKPLLAAAAVAATLLGSRAVWADDAGSIQAAEEFEAGLTALEQSQFREAAEHFEESSRLEPNGAALFSAAKAWLAEGDRARAADSFAAALESSLLRKAEMVHAEKQLSALQAELSVLEISGDESMSVRLAGRPVVSPPATLHAEPGNVTLVVVSGTREKNIELVLVAGERAPIDLRPALVRAPESDAPAREVPSERAGKASSVGTDSGAGAPDSDLYRRIAIFGGIGTGVGVAFTVSFGVLALGAKGDFEEEPTRANFDKAIRFETGTNIALVATSVLGVASATFLTLSFVLEPDEPGGGDTVSQSRLHLGARPGGLFASGQF